VGQDRSPAATNGLRRTEGGRPSSKRCRARWSCAAGPSCASGGHVTLSVSATLPARLGHQTLDFLKKPGLLKSALGLRGSSDLHPFPLWNVRVTRPKPQNPPIRSRIAAAISLRSRFSRPSTYTFQAKSADRAPTQVAPTVVYTSGVLQPFGIRSGSSPSGYRSTTASPLPLSSAQGASARPTPAMQLDRQPEGRQSTSAPERCPTRR